MFRMLKELYKGMLSTIEEKEIIEQMKEIRIAYKKKLSENHSYWEKIHNTWDKPK